MSLSHEVKLGAQSVVHVWTADQSQTRRTLAGFVEEVAAQLERLPTDRARDGYGT